MANGYRPRRYFPKRKTYSKAKTTTKARVARKVYKTNFNKKVLAVVNRISETKLKTASIADNHNIYGQGLLSTSQNQGSGHAGYLIPNLLGSSNLLGIASGTEQEQKVGNKVRDAKIVVSGVIKSLPYNATTNPYISPFEVHMVCFKSKNDPEANPLQLKSKDNNTLGTIDGTLENTLYPYNKDKYIIHKIRVFKLRGHRAEETNGNQAWVNPVGGQASNLPAFARFKCECPISNKLLFNDGASVPTNSWCALGFYVVDGMNNTITNTHARASLFLEGKITFKDD